MTYAMAHARPDFHRPMRAGNVDRFAQTKSGQTHTASSKEKSRFRHIQSPQGDSSGESSHARVYRMPASAPTTAKQP